jgi:rfaE bifunctional protein nucleotidyltransferase chain/domain
MSLMGIEQALEARQGKRLVTTNGVFDVLHVGHVRLLREAAALGDLLFVLVNTDESARRLAKGPGRPFNPLSDRAELLAGLRSVDAVLAFDEDTPTALLERLRPDAHVKGGDYRADDLPEAAVVRSHGGEVVVLPFRPGYSTTALAARIRSSPSD